MKPLRVAMTHSLLVNYDLLDHMDIFRPSMASFENLTNFHSTDYINFLRSVCPENMEEMNDDLYKYNVGEDCPVFKGLYDYCCSTSGGSLCAAYKLNAGAADIAINWSGGLHHAKRNEASGFCYVNDIVLGILELLKYHERVLYIDIDVHHGDGVEEAFYVTDRVMTVSFHKYGDYFPGTGIISDCGLLKGKNYAVNVPLNDGMNDESYRNIFQPIISKVVEVFRPGVIVFQSGADSLAGDRLGCFNLSHRGHASCIEFVKKLGIPIMVLGGGGYTIKNVSRAWTYETSVILDVDIPENLPFNEYFEHFGPEYKLSIPTSNMVNKNSREYLEEIYQTICENLRNVTPVPSVQMIERPPDFVDEESDEETLWSKFKEESGLETSLTAEDVRQEVEN